MRIKCCPSCGSSMIGRGKILRRCDRTYIGESMPHRWFLECASCHWRSEERLFLFRAKRAWNRKIPRFDYTETVTLDLPDIIIDSETVRRNLDAKNDS